jgi:hypothetical protein
MSKFLYSSCGVINLDCLAGVFPTQRQDCEGKWYIEFVFKTGESKFYENLDYDAMVEEYNMISLMIDKLSKEITK